MPEWEAASKEVLHLLEAMTDEFDTHLLAMNNKHRRLVLTGKQKHLPLPWGAAGLPFFRSYASRFDLNHIVASLSERHLVSRLKGPKTILTASKDDPSMQTMEGNLKHVRELPAVIVESLWHREMLLQAGLDRERIHLIYPGKAIQPYTRPDGPFTIVFATSPRGPNDFLARGIHLMLEVAKVLPEVRFRLVWRKLMVEEVRKAVADRGVTNVEILNGTIDDMNAVYAAAHAVILPGLTKNSIKPCPHSALDGLAHGKPILASRPMSIAPIIAERKCGVIFEADRDGLVHAIQTLVDDYDTYQVNCHPVAKDTFSPEVFIERHRALYRSLL